MRKKNLCLLRWICCALEINCFNPYPEVVIFLGQQCSKIWGCHIPPEAFFNASSRFRRDTDNGSVVLVTVAFNNIVSSIRSVCPVIKIGKVCCVHPVVSKKQESIPWVNEISQCVLISGQLAVKYLVQLLMYLLSNCLAQVISFTLLCGKIMQNSLCPSQKEVFCTFFDFKYLKIET